MTWSTVQLRDGTPMPQLAIGSASSAHTGDDYSEDLAFAFKAGFKHCDCAQNYGTEKAMGKGLKRVNRKDIFVTTKWSGKTTLQQGIKDSLGNLDVDYVDLYLIHEPSICEGAGIVGHWKDMLALKRDKLAHNVGVSNFAIRHLEEIEKAGLEMPAVLQIFITPYNYARRSELFDYCRKYSIVVESYTLLFSLTHYKGGPLDAAVNAVAEKHKVPAERVLLAWAKSKDITPVVATRSRDRIQSYIAAGELNLSEEDVKMIEQAGAKGDAASRKNPWGDIESDNR